MSEISEKSSEGEKMSATALAEAHLLVQQVAGDSGSVKERLLRASRALPTFSFNRVRDLFYADPRARVGGDELDYLRSKVGSANLKAAQDEYAELGKRVARLEALLSESENHRRSLLDAGRDAAGLSHRTMGRGQ